MKNGIILEKNGEKVNEIYFLESGDFGIKNNGIIEAISDAEYAEIINKAEADGCRPVYYLHGRRHTR